MTMNQTTRRATSLALAALTGAAALTGCASSQEADDLYATNRALEERNLMLQQEVQAKDNSISLLRSRVNEGDETVAQVRDRNSALQADLRRLEERYRTLAGRLDRVSLGVVDPQTERALQRLAEANPNLFTFSAEDGLLRFNSDVTFAAGSDQVSDAAKNALTQIAGVLSQASTGYDLRIVGHTDNVKPSRPQTLKNHPTNLHLSAHRAISVRNVLASAGVPSNRMLIGGWGEQRPAVPNRSGQGTPQNRRVEIYIVPASSESSDAPARQQQEQTEPEAEQTSRPDPFK